MLSLSRALRPAALVGLLVALPACNQIAYEDLQDEQLSALCDYFVRCGYATDADLCVAAWKNFTRDDPNLDAAVDNGSVEYDAKAAKECLDSLRDGACDADFLFGDDAPSDACNKVFQGTVDNGGACWIDEQCVSGACQAGDCGMACCQGTCIAPPPDAAIGQDCSAQDCVDGAYCDYDFMTGEMTCKAIKQAGAECGGDNECAGSLACLGGTCKEPPAEGAPCPDGRCAGALGCDIDTVTCQKLRGEGQACNPQASLCAIGLTCAASNTCQPPGGIGSPCTLDFSGGSCAGDAWCDYDFLEGKGTCQPLIANGGACESNEFACQSRYCGEDGLCAPEPICVQ